MTIVCAWFKVFNSKQYAQKYADIVTQSFHPVKAITTGEGVKFLQIVKKFIINNY